MLVPFIIFHPKFQNPQTSFGSKSGLLWVYMRAFMSSGGGDTYTFLWRNTDVLFDIPCKQNASKIWKKIWLTKGIWPLGSGTKDCEPVLLLQSAKQTNKKTWQASWNASTRQNKWIKEVLVSKHSPKNSLQRSKLWKNENKNVWAAVVICLYSWGNRCSEGLEPKAPQLAEAGAGQAGVHAIAVSPVWASTLTSVSFL